MHIISESVLMLLTENHLN